MVQSAQIFCRARAGDSIQHEYTQRDAVAGVRDQGPSASWKSIPEGLKNLCVPPVDDKNAPERLKPMSMDRALLARIKSPQRRGPIAGDPGNPCPFKTSSS